MTAPNMMTASAPGIRNVLAAVLLIQTASPGSDEMRVRVGLKNWTEGRIVLFLWRLDHDNRV